MVLQYFPKGTDFAKLTAADVQRFEGLLNNRPRKHSIINYQLSNKVFTKLTAPPTLWICISVSKSIPNVKRGLDIIT